jgi:Zn finger protein HypA/HybF involved in hydrogenase expression
VIVLGKISEMPYEEFKEAIESSSFMSEILEKLGYSRQSGSSAKKVKERALRDDISLDHILTYRQSDKRVHYTYNHSLDDILVENSKYTNNSRLKIRLIREKMLKNECYECGLPPFWNGKKLTLQLDHINGNNTDNRLSNLRLLCPNCHSQTETFGSKNFK